MEPRRRVVSAVAGAALVLIAIGMAALVFDPGLSGAGVASTRGAGTTVPASNSPTASPSRAPSPSGSRGSSVPGTPQTSDSNSPLASVGSPQTRSGFLQQGEGFIYVASDGSVIPVIPVPGLRVEIDKGRALYYALASNRYGLGAGSLAGEFMPLVTMGQADGSSAATGGIVLGGLVVARLISDKLASMPADADRWIVALPVDIRTAGKTPVDVSFDQFGLAGWSNTPRVVVRFSGSLPVVETIPSNGGCHVLVEQLGATSWQIIDPVRLGLPPGTIDSAHVMNQLLVYGNGTPTIDGALVQRDIFIDRRVPIGQQIISVTSDVSVSLVASGSRAELGPDKVLAVADVPVFVAAG
jgi:hypothetical protein